MEKDGKLELFSYWKQAADECRRIRTITGGGLLGAAGVVLKSLTIPITTTLRISFAFLPFALAGYLYGPLAAGCTGVVVDVIGYLVSSSSGPYFFGFTLNAFVNGMLYGICLYNKKISIYRCVMACFLSMVLVNLCLNPLWLSMLYGNAFWVLLGERLFTNALLFPVNTAMLFGILKVTERYKKLLRVP